MDDGEPDIGENNTITVVELGAVTFDHDTFVNWQVMFVLWSLENLTSFEDVGRMFP